MLKSRFWVLISAIFISGCGGGSDSQSEPPQPPPPPPINQLPIVSAGADQTVEELTQVQLVGEASDSDGSINSTQWRQVSGPIVTIENKNSLNASFISPETITNQILEFEIEATDNEGATNKDIVNITVTPVNIPPIINIEGNLEYFAGDTVRVDASKSYDPDGTIVSYKWVQLSGIELEIVDPNNPTLTLVLQNYEIEQSFQFALEIKDNENAISTQQFTIKVKPIINQPPVANAGEDILVTETNLFLLDARQSFDTDGQIVSYKWSQLEGIPLEIKSPELDLVQLSAPPVYQNETATIKLEVIDDDGLLSEDTVTIQISDEFKGNIPPVIESEPSKNNNSGDMVNLDPNVTDIDSTNLVYTWKQVSGTEALIDTPYEKGVTITTPNVSVDEELIFSLTVEDSWNSITQDFSINLNAPPTIITQSELNVEELTTVYLDASNSSDNDGEILEFEWLQIGGDEIFLNDSSKAIASFEAPKTYMHSSPNRLFFQLKVTDQYGAFSEVDVKVTVNAVNEKPVITFSGKNTFEIGETIKLQPTITDSDGSIISLKWDANGFVSDKESFDPTHHVGYFDKALDEQSNEFIFQYTNLFTEREYRAAGELTFELTATDDDLEKTIETFSVVINSPFDVYATDYEFENSFVDTNSNPIPTNVFHVDWNSDGLNDYVIDTHKGLFWYQASNNQYTRAVTLNLTIQGTEDLFISDYDDDENLDLFMSDPSFEINSPLDIATRESALYLLKKSSNQEFYATSIISSKELDALLNNGHDGNFKISNLINNIVLHDIDQDNKKDLLLLVDLHNGRSGKMILLKQREDSSFSEPKIILENISQPFDENALQNKKYITFSNNCPKEVGLLECENNYKKSVNIYEYSQETMQLVEQIIEPHPFDGWDKLAGYTNIGNHEAILINAYDSIHKYHYKLYKKKDTNNIFELENNSYITNLARDESPFIDDLNNDGVEDLIYLIKPTEDNIAVKAGILNASGEVNDITIDEFPKPISEVTSSIGFGNWLKVDSNTKNLISFIHEPISYSMESSSFFEKTKLFQPSFESLRGVARNESSLFVAAECSGSLLSIDINEKNINVIAQYISNPKEIIHNDINSDNIQDLIVLTSLSNDYCLGSKFVSQDILVFEGKPDNGFKKPYKVNVVHDTIAIDIADMNQDSIPDLVLMGQRASGKVLFGDSSGLTTRESHIPFYQSYDKYNNQGNRKIVDIDNDGDLDIVNSFVGDGFNNVYLHINDGSGNFTASRLFFEDVYETNILKTFTRISVFDIDNDNDLDIVGLKKLPFDDKRIGLFKLTNSDGIFDYSLFENYTSSWSSKYPDDSLISFDINNDGYKDLVTPDTFMLNDTLGGFFDYVPLNSSDKKPSTYTQGKFKADFIFPYDINSDGNIDILRANHGKLVFDINKTIN